MRYDEFFRNFYIGDSDGLLTGYYTTWAIPKFFVDTIIQKDEHRKKLPQDDMSYDKWFQGTATPRNHWSNFKKEYQEETLVKALEEIIEKSNINKLLTNFNVELIEGEPVNYSLLYKAIAQQFEALIDGKGEAEDIVPVIYQSGNIKADFMEYIHKATQRYSVMKLIGGDEVPINDFFVCNTIGAKEKVFAEKNELKCEYLDNPDLTAIRNIFKKRKYDNLRTLLLGSGGCGKSLMLQSLFLKAANEYPRTGILPIFVELRNFKQGDDLKSFIVETVSSKDPKFTEEIAYSLLLSGHCQLLLDGFDEIDPSDVDSFLKKLADFGEDYDKLQIVITSRNNESLTGVRGYTRLYVWPFNTNQSMLLIDKILKYQNQMSWKQKVIDYISNGFLQKDGVFASHPLLLTFVTMNYPTYKKFNDNHLLFYKLTFNALLSGHDDNKKPYDRVFMSVDDAEQFAKVFKQFCAFTYRDGKTQLNTAEFEVYFNQLTAHLGFKNPFKMKISKFKHDVCSTACIMYEKAYDLYYIDPGFQEYLFAEYYSIAETNEVKGLQQSLVKIPYRYYERFDALEMLHCFAKEKFEFFVLKPFLDSIFKGSEEEAFLSFLCNCFNEINVVNSNPVAVVTFLKMLNTKIVLYPSINNYPKTILVDYILKILGFPHDYDFTLRADYVGSLPDDVEEKGKLIGQENSVCGTPALLIDNKPNDAYVLLNKMSKQGEDCRFFVDEQRNLISFGNRIYIDSFFLSEKPDNYIELVKNIMKNSKETYEMFTRFREYHKRLRIEHHRKGYK